MIKPVVTWRLGFCMIGQTTIDPNWLDAMPPYPDPVEMPAEQAPVIHCRARVVIQAFDYDQAKRIAERVAEFAACNVEMFVGVAAMDDNRSLGEVPFKREFFPVTIDGQPAMMLDDGPTSELDEAS